MTTCDWRPLGLCPDFHSRELMGARGYSLTGDYYFIATAHREARSDQWTARLRIFSRLGVADAALQGSKSYATAEAALAAAAVKGRQVIRGWNDVGSSIDGGISWGD